ncbi:uncharacterized protein [Clytia hemisphaerica]|uniref:SCP domain-containing protein n=1 Tax=Clytia hemisphaerica TaxID=252671 RepID=A0A7M5WWF5_9CNID
MLLEALFITTIVSAQGGVFVRKEADLWVYRGYGPACSEGINKIRAAFGDENLTWDDELSLEAENWALTQAINSPNDDSKHADTKNGENTFQAWYSTVEQFIDAITCDYPLWAWYQERDPKKPSKGLINQLVGEKVKKYGMGMVVNTAKKVVYFVGHFDYNMPIDRKIWDDYLSKKEKWVIPSRDRLKSKKGSLTPSCRDYKRNIIPCKSSFRRTRYHQDEERHVIVIEPKSFPIVL